MKKTKVHIVSLGCPKNLVDSEVMSAGLVQSGYALTPHEEEAEIILINTCAFILPAKEESIAEILRLAEWKKKGACRYLVVTGCLSQRYTGDLEKDLPEVDLFLGTAEAGSIAKHLQAMQSDQSQARSNIAQPTFLMTHLHQRILATPSYSAYLKIAEGCSNRCSYCIIPSIRGGYRSRKEADILKEAETLADQGVRELILIAQDVTAYGSDLSGKSSLAALLTALSGIKGIRWIRLLYTHPESLTDDVLEVMAGNEKICRYIDFPIQHIDDDILKAMHRRVDSALIKAKIERARYLMPDVALRTSIIVGFPGEKQKHFNKLIDFVLEARFDHLGVFTYSREEGTPAADLAGQVGEKVKQKRRDLLMEEQAAISYEINQSLIGSIQEIIIEGDSDRPGYLAARSRRQAPEIDGITYLKKGKMRRPGSIIPCRIVSATEYDLFAEEEK